ncbi:hypothetical protein EDD21DRAFT_388260 [Dissophora ornata]|nr:hypothetical protein EDD21DRAFT_388260 [Dissophora ornata]
MDVSAEYKAAKRSMRIKMSAQLNAEEAQIKAGTHPELLAELKAIEDRREARTKVVQAQKDCLQRMWEINFQAVCKAANDQYRAGQVTARRNIIDLVQSRMNRIKQEMAQSRRAAGIPSPRRLTYVRPVEVTGYDSCGESCSSYDSYTSSGSECSDCEICKPPRQLQIPQLKTPKGLSRREVAVDLAFLFPESSSSSSRIRHPEEYTTSQNLSGPSRPHSPEGDEAAHRRISKNQQYMIDHLNDEKRRKRRVMDREMQNKAAYKKHSAGDKGGKGSEGGGEDMEIDQDQGQDPDQQEREVSATQSAAESGSRQHSPIFARKTARPNPNKNAKHYRPRFLPGFGPDGLQVNSRTKESLPAPRSMQKYPFTDRYGRSWDSSRHGISPPSSGHRNDVRPYSLMEREAARMHGVRPPHDQYHQERNGSHSAPPHHDFRQPNHHHYYQGHQPYRYPEHAEAQHRSRYPQDQRASSSVIPHGRQHPQPVPRYSAEAVYPFDDKTMSFKNPYTASHRRAPPPVDPANQYQVASRGRPLKNPNALPWGEPGSRNQGAHSGADGNTISLTRPSASPRAATNGSTLGQHEGRHEGGAAVEEGPDKLEGALTTKERSEATNENTST